MSKCPQMLTHCRVSSAIRAAKEMQALGTKPTSPNDLNVSSRKAEL